MIEIKPIYNSLKQQCLNPSSSILKVNRQRHKHLFIKFCTNSGSLAHNLPVKAFIKLERERVNILKNGSRTGYFFEPQRVTCSSMCETPVLSIGVVRNPTL